MYELVKQLTQTILGLAVIIFIITKIKKIIKERQIREQIKTKELQEYYKKQDKMKNTENTEKIEKHKTNISYSPYKINNNIFTNAERYFYKILKKIAVNLDLNILAKVRLADIINTNNYKYFNKVKAKHIDFVLIDQEGNIKTLIELDDKSHRNKKRIERDDFLNKIFENQKLKLLRIPVKYTYNTQELEKIVKESLL